MKFFQTSIEAPINARTVRNLSNDQVLSSTLKNPLMKTNRKNHLFWKILLFLFVLGCTDQEFSDNARTPDLESLVNERANLPAHLRDSTINAEKNIQPSKPDDEPKQSPINASSFATVNYARQAVVTAESTYSGYSVSRIKDGSRNTTVGPSYSWANNYPAGGKLPESVFLRFYSLKTIERIDIYTSSGYELQNYTILYRTALNAPWVHLLNVVGNRSVYLSHSFSPVTVLEVQIRCELGPPNQTIYGRLNEVEIYGEPEPYVPYFTTENGRLVFSSGYDVEQAISYLEYKYDQYSDAFVSQYPGATDEELELLEESTGFNDNQPYIDFENAYGIYSLRARVAAEEEAWLENTTGDNDASYPDPDDQYGGDDDERALMNYWGEMKIGTDIYVFNPDGSYYQYYDDSGGGGGGCDEICAAKLRNRKEGDPLPEGVKHVKPIALTALVDGCERVIRSKDFITNASGTWRFKWKIKAVSGIFGGSAKIKAVTKSYKKKNGKWKVKGNRIGAGGAGHVRDTYCTAKPIDFYSGDKWKRKAKKKAYWEGYIKPNEMQGEFYHKEVGRHFRFLE
jgi:hypothetical protein